MFIRDLNFGASWFINYTSEEVHRFNLTLLYPLNHCIPSVPHPTTNQSTLASDSVQWGGEKLDTAVVKAVLEGVVAFQTVLLRLTGMKSKRLINFPFGWILGQPFITYVLILEKSIFFNLGRKSDVWKCSGISGSKNLVISLDWDEIQTLNLTYNLNEVSACDLSSMCF